MRLYIVHGGWDYEGEEILGVFDTEEQAKRTFKRVRLEYAKPDKFHGRNGYFDFARISVHELNRIDSSSEEYLK